MNRIIQIIGFALVLWISTGVTKVSAQDFVVIVNNSNGISSMKSVEVKLYYMRKIKQQWPEMGVAILPVGISSNQKSKEAFLTTVMKMSDSELDAYFKQRQFANAEALPATFATEEEVIDYVAKNKGAIGYVSKAVYDAKSTKVKALTIN